MRREIPKLFLEEDLATSPTLTSLERVYIGLINDAPYSEGVAAIRFSKLKQ
jgi:hypothetical protein